MKPKDLKSEFTFEERRPCLADSVFYVPIYYQNYGCFKLPSFQDYFGNDHPICIEYCSGNGDWIVEKAREQSQKNWIAVEKRFDRVKKIWSKMKNYAVKNLLMVSGEALTFTQNYLLDNCVDEVFINFPDPWPKTKHAKNRLIKDQFLDELARTLKRGGKTMLVTDDRAYVAQAASLFCSHTQFSPSFPPPYYCLDIKSYGGSWFEKLWREQGRSIHYLEFEKLR